MARDNESSVAVNYRGEWITTLIFLGLIALAGVVGGVQKTIDTAPSAPAAVTAGH